MPTAPTARRRGLTFIELMFATIILGVGMIIIASVFPVAINEQRMTLDEGSVNSLERAAARTLEAAVAVKGASTLWLTATAADTTPTDTSKYTGGVDSFANKPALWDRIKGDLVNTGDPRYAFSPLYMRAPQVDDNSVTFFIVTLASKDKAAFDNSSDVELDRLKPANVKITYYFKEDTVNPTYDSGKLAFDPEQDTIKVEAGASNANAKNTIDAAVTGGYVIRAVNVKTGPWGPSVNRLFPQNAIIKLGSQFEGDELKDPSDPDTKIFRVAPGFELNYGDVNVVSNAVSGVPAFAVGADPTDKTKKANRAISCRAVTVYIKDPG